MLHLNVPVNVGDANCAYDAAATPPKNNELLDVKVATFDASPASVW